MVGVRQSPLQNWNSPIELVLIGIEKSDRLFN